MANGAKIDTANDSGAKFSEKTGGAYADMTAVIQSELNRITGTTRDERVCLSENKGHDHVPDSGTYSIRK